MPTNSPTNPMTDLKPCPPDNRPFRQILDEDFCGVLNESQRDYIEQIHAEDRPAHPDRELVEALGNMLDETRTTARGDWPRELYCVDCGCNVSRMEPHADNCKIGQANEVWERLSALNQPSEGAEGAR